MKFLKNRYDVWRDALANKRAAFANRFAGQSAAQIALLAAKSVLFPVLYIGKKTAILILPSRIDRSIPRIRDEFRNASVGGKIWLGTKLVMKGVGIWLWPPAARFERPFSRIGAQMKLKRGIKALAAIIGVVVAQNVVQVGTAQLFPTGEDFLKTQGIDPKYVKDVSDHRIRVRSRDFWGKLHATFDIPTIFGVVQSLGMQSQSVQAWAIRGIGNSVKGETHSNFRNDCMVMLPRPDITVKEAINAMTGIPKDMIENTPASDREIFLAFTFHEFAHCDTQNGKTAFKEEDADLRGIPTAAKITGNKELTVLLMHARAMNTTAGDHDTSLYLDAAIKKETLPDNFSEMENDSSDLFTLAELYKERKYGIKKPPTAEDFKAVLGGKPPKAERPEFLKEVEAIRYVLQNHSDLLSANAIRRGQMYIEAAAYFAPKAVAKAVPVNIPLKTLTN